MLSAAAYLIAVLDYLRAKRTSLLTRKRALRAMQLLIVRSRGFCPRCPTEFENLKNLLGRAQKEHIKKPRFRGFRNIV